MRVSLSSLHGYQKLTCVQLNLKQMKFIKPQNIVAQMGLKTGQTVADFGSGSGFYTLSAAQMVGNTGRVLAVDVQKSKLTATFSAGSQQGL